MSASKAGLEVHLRIPKGVAKALDELMAEDRQLKRNELLVVLLRDALQRKRHARRQARYRSRRKAAHSQ